MPAATDLTGEIFGKLTVLKRMPSKGVTSYLCLCQCGKEKVVRGGNLVSGNTTTCGCSWGLKKITHGHTRKRKSSTYRSWVDMKVRCTNPKSKAYKNYGGRGITICPEWLCSFENFLSDMGVCPPGWSLERVDPDGNYSKQNCSWLPKEKQNANKRNTRWITFGGETLHVEEWARRTGFGDRLRHRLRSGWSVERALTTPLRPMKPSSLWKRSLESSSLASEKPSI
jgi:hypothetical protein